MTIMTNRKCEPSVTESALAVGRFSTEIQSVVLLLDSLIYDWEFYFS